MQDPMPGVVSGKSQSDVDVNVVLAFLAGQQHCLHPAIGPTSSFYWEPLLKIPWAAFRGDLLFFLLLLLLSNEFQGLLLFSLQLHLSHDTSESTNGRVRSSHQQRMHHVFPAIFGSRSDLFGSCMSNFPRRQHCKPLSYLSFSFSLSKVLALYIYIFINVFSKFKK